MKKEPKKMGGYREGAGRKKTGLVKKQTFAFSLQVENMTRLETLAKERGLTKSSLLDEILEKYFNE
jgi:predicted DNA-binding protein